MEDYSPLNAYQNLEVLIADSPQALVAELKKFSTPIKVLAIVQAGTRSVAYIMGDIRRVKPKETPVVVTGKRPGK